MGAQASPTTPTTAPSATTPTTRVDTGTVPVVQDGTGKALLIGSAFVAIILAGALVARVWSKREMTSPGAEPEPAQRHRPLVFDQDHTDGKGRPIPSASPGAGASRPAPPPTAGPRERR